MSLTDLHHFPDSYLLSHELTGLQLGDERINIRGKLLLDSLSQANYKSINSACTNHAQTAGAYRFFSNSKVQTVPLLKPHLEQTIQRASEHQTISVIQDTSELEYSNLKTLKGAGPISSLSRRGLFMHPSLIVAHGGLPLGVSKMDFIVRKDEEHGKSADKKKLPIEEKESFRWLEGYRHACDIAKRLPDCEVFSVADREADIFEIFAEHYLREKSDHLAAHYIIRAKENRVLLGEYSDLKLFDLGQQGEPLGTIEFEVPASKQSIKVKGKRVSYQRQKRCVTQELRAHKVRPRVPQRSAASANKLPEVELWIVSAIEINAPEDQRPICWRLLTDKPVLSLHDAKKIVRIYTERWTIETFFRTLKSGCKVEQLGLKEVDALKRAITLLSISAWRQLHLTHLARKEPDLPCGRIFESHEWQGSMRVIFGEQWNQTEPRLGDFLLEIAKLGGYLGRKNDPPPGAEAIWRGMIKVEAYGEAWKAFQKSS